MTGSAGANEPQTAMAVGAHPDDIEFMMAGTLLLLKEAGLEIHMWSMANGCYGTTSREREQIIAFRWEEARASAKVAGAIVHRPLVDDLEIIYEPGLLSRVVAVIREVKPDILLIPSPQDYMKDHSNCSSLMITASSARGVGTYATSPPVEPWAGEMVIYHALPFGLRDGLRRLIRPGMYIDIGSVLGKKRSMLAEHHTQERWIEESQGVSSNLDLMEVMSAEVGAMSGVFDHAEGWRRHLHIGFSSVERDPLKTLLGRYCRIDEEYERSLG